MAVSDAGLPIHIGVGWKGGTDAKTVIIPPTTFSLRFNALCAAQTTVQKAPKQ